MRIGCANEVMIQRACKRVSSALPVRLGVLTMVEMCGVRHVL